MSRTILIVVLLVASLVLVGVLTYQAVDSALSAQATARSALRGYATLTVWEFARRSVGDMSYPLFYAGNTIHASRAEGDGLPGPDRLAEGANEMTRQGLSWVERYFRINDDRVRVSGAPASAELISWVERHATELISSAAGQVHASAIAPDEADGLQHILLVVRGSNSTFTTILDLDLVGLGSLFEQVFNERELFPPSLGGGYLTNDAVFLEVATPDGRTLFRTDGEFDEAIGARPELPPQLEGLVVRASIRPDAAGLLVSGGIPTSRLPVLLAILAVTAGLLGTAIHQLRRQQELARLRSDFVASVSHELRTPLTQIRMFTETLRLGRTRSEEEAQQCLEIVDQESQRLSHLVENILQFSRAERKALRISPERLDLTARVRDLASRFLPLASSRGATLTTTLPEQAPADVDADAFSQILLNLLDNAVRYGPHGQEILIGLTRDPAAVQVWVDDQGPGVPPEDRDRIWQKFERLPATGRAAAAGAGIGLSVVRELTELHGGRAWVTDGARGGARFVVELPVRAA